MQKHVKSLSAGAVSSFSSYGPATDLSFKPDLAAPGSLLVRLFPPPIAEARIDCWVRVLRVIFTRLESHGLDIHVRYERCNIVCLRSELANLYTPKKCDGLHCASLKLGPFIVVCLNRCALLAIPHPPPL